MPIVVDVEEPAPDLDREVSTIFAVRCVRYLRRTMGDEAVARMLALADLGDRESQVITDPGWCSLHEILAVASATATVCDDPDIGRRIGEEQFREQHVDGIAAFMRDSGSIQTVLEMTTDFASKMSETSTCELISVVDDEAVIQSRSKRSQTSIELRFFCGMTTGYFGSLPSLFGLVGSAVELTCQHRDGSPSCRYRLVWERPAAVPARSAANGMAGSLRRLEQLRTMAAEMAAPEDLSAVLDRLVHGAAASFLAPRTMLVVRLPGEARPRVHQIGFATDELATATAQVEDGTLGVRPEVATAPVRSASHHYGELVAISPKGTTAAPYEIQTLCSFANYAAAALDAAVALAESRRNRAAAEALLALASALATTTDADHVAARLAAATPDVIGPAQVGVLLCDRSSTAVRAAACNPDDAGFARPGLQRAVLEALQLPELVRPEVLDVSTTGAALARALTAAGISQAVAVPIRAHDEPFGVLLAAHPDGTTEAFDETVLDRLQGLADQGAGALHNIGLLDRVRHQAMHDSLTGLPNRLLMADRAERALAQAKRTGTVVGLLFVDLDRFKEVNDTHGHAAGDDLIRAVADRLSASFRSSDTVARQGGDELVVVLPNLASTDHARRAGEKVVEAMSEPFPVGDTEITMSASVGVAWSTAGLTPFEVLLQHADKAMYEAKARGRNKVACLDGPADATADTCGLVGRRSADSLRTPRAGPIMQG